MAVNTTEIQTVYNSLLSDTTTQLDTLYNSEKITGDQYATILSAQMTAAMQLAVTSVQQQELNTVQIAKANREVTLIEGQINLNAEQIIKTQEEVDLLQSQDLEVLANTTRQNELSAAQKASVFRDVTLKERQIAKIQDEINRLQAETAEITAATARQDDMSAVQIAIGNREVTLKEEQVSLTSAQKAEVLASTIRQNDVAEQQAHAVHDKRENDNQLAKVQVANGYKQMNVLDSQIGINKAQEASVIQKTANDKNMSESQVKQTDAQAALIERQTSGFDDNLRLQVATLYAEMIGLAASNNTSVSGKVFADLNTLLDLAHPDSISGTASDFTT